MSSANIARPPLNPDAVPWSPQLTGAESDLLTRLNPISWLIEQSRDVPRSPFISNYQAPSPDRNDCQLQTLPLIPSIIPEDETIPHTYDALVEDGSESWLDAPPRQKLEYLKFLSCLSVENCSNQFEQLLQKVADQKENYLIDDGPLPSDVPFIVTPLPPTFPPRPSCQNDNQSANQFVAQNSITYVNYDCNNPHDLNAELTRRAPPNISINPPYVMTLSFTSNRSPGPMLDDNHNIVISSNQPFERNVLKNVYKLLQISSDIDAIPLEDITGMNNIFDRRTDTVAAFKRAAETVRQEDDDRAAAAPIWMRDEASDPSSDAGSDSGSDDGSVIRDVDELGWISNSGDSSPAVARDPLLQQDIEDRIEEYRTLADAGRPGFDILSQQSRNRFYNDVFPDILTALTDELSSLFNRLGIHDPNWGISRGANRGAYTFDMLYGAYMNTPPLHNGLGEPPGRLAKLIDRNNGEISDDWREVIKGNVELPQNIIDELVTEMALPEPAAMSSEEIAENAQRAVAAHAAANPADPMDVYDKLGELCSVCYGNPIDIDLKHGGTFHHIICSQCADLLERADGHQNCPIDRQRIEEQRPSNVAAAKKAYYDAVVSHDVRALPELERTVREALQTASDTHTVSNIDNDTFEHLEEIAHNPSLRFLSSKRPRRSHKRHHKRSRRRSRKNRPKRSHRRSRKNRPKRSRKKSPKRSHRRSRKKSPKRSHRRSRKNRPKQSRKKSHKRNPT